jgi:NADPH:quinone reductase-like Zn-dependent oxidoreductase
MKAVVLNEVGKPLMIKDVPEPQLRPGGVAVQVESVPVLSYKGKHWRRRSAGRLGHGRRQGDRAW